MVEARVNVFSFNSDNPNVNPVEAHNFDSVIIASKEFQETKPGALV